MFSRRDFVCLAAAGAACPVVFGSDGRPRLMKVADCPEIGKPLALWRQGELDVHFVYTGRGENMFYRFPDGTTMVNDTGDFYRPKEVKNAIGTLYGSGDGATTFNLPDLTDRVVQGSATAGTALAAGLPNITGDIKLRPNSSGLNSFFGITGAFSMGAQSNLTAGAFDMGSTSGTTYNPVTFNASVSNAIYGNSTTVQQPALTMIYCIKY